MRFSPGHRFAWRSSETNSCGGYDFAEGCDGVSYAWYSHPCRRYVHNSLIYFGTLSPQNHIESLALFSDEEDMTFYIEKILLTRSLGPLGSSWHGK
jgi:hypothetical protein